MASYSKPSIEELRTLVSHYPIGQILDMAPQEGGQANTSYRIKTDTGSYMLSICDEKTHREIQVLLQVLNQLNANRFPTSTPIATREGQYLLEFQGKPVYLKAFIPGQVVPDLSPAMLEGVGQAMAQLHAIPAPEAVAPAFPYGFTAFDSYLAAPVDHDFTPWLREQKALLEREMDKEMPKGLIHGDIFWDNLVFEGEGLKAILDFEEACNDYFLFDLGMAAVGCCSRGGTFVEDRVKALIRGYESRCPLSDREREQLPLFMVYAATAGAFWRFCQYNIHHPDPQLKDSHRELSALGDINRARSLKI